MKRKIEREKVIKRTVRGDAKLTHKKRKLRFPGKFKRERAKRQNT